MRNKRKVILLFALLTLFLIGAVILNISIGSSDIGLKTLFNNLFFNKELSRAEYNILFKIRFPRIIAAMLFGGALSLSGFLLQTFFRNPIVGPFVLGISSGARLFVSFFTLNAFSWVLISGSNFGMFFVSFLGSMLAMMLVLVFARTVKAHASLIVIGIMIGYIASAGTNFMIAFAADNDIANLQNWSLGSFSGITWDMIRISVIIIIPCVILVFFLSKPLEGFLLGENYAKSMGINIKAFRIILIFLSSMLSASVTAFAGPVSFVGIAVPHLTKRLTRTSNPRILTPAIFLLGGTFALLSDLIARTLFAPIELNLSTVTSLIGAPIVIYLMMNRRQKHR